MGFHIQIEGSGSALLKKLRASPASVFDQPYKGYLLFLAGAADQDVCEWIADNTVQLDSLTGDDVAYAVFARRFEMRLSTNSSSGHTSARSPQVLGTIDSKEIAGEPWRVEQLVKSGRWGWAVDQDELVAVTYAVDDLARNLGVLDKLPCVIVLDAIPGNDINVLRLSPEVRSAFLSILRRSLALMAGSERFSDFDERINDLIKLYDEVESASKRKEVANLKLERAISAAKSVESRGPVPASDLATIQARLSSAEAAVRSGSLRDLRAALSGGRKRKPLLKSHPIPGILPGQLESILTIAERHQRKIWLLGRTIQALVTANSSREPSRSVELQAILNGRSIELLVPGFELQENPSAEMVAALGARLADQRDQLVDNILETLPSAEKLMSQLKESTKDLHAAVARRKNEKVATLRAEVEKLESDPNNYQRSAQEKFDLAAREYLSGRPPSFWAAVSQSLREMKMTDHSLRVQAWAVEIAAGIFKPDFLLKMWQAVTG